MKVYFATNDDDEIIGMSLTRIGKREEPIEITDTVFEQLKGSTAGFKIVDEKLVKSTQAELASAKQAKKEELNLACQEHILDGFDYEIKGIEYHFSYDREAQLNMQETFQMFQNDMIKTIMWTVKLKNEHTRITLDRPIFNLVYTASLQHKQNAISRLRDKLLPILNQATTLEAVNVVKWDVLVVEPSPEPVIFNSENLVDKQIESLSDKIAQGDTEIFEAIISMIYI